MAAMQRSNGLNTAYQYDADGHLRLARHECLDHVLVV
jgi:hypothetical protein